MMTTKLNVVGCEDCPLESQGDCQHPDAPNRYDQDPAADSFYCARPGEPTAPLWCPLRKTPITIERGEMR